MRTMEVETEQPRDINTTNQTHGTVTTANQTLANVTAANQTLANVTTTNQTIDPITTTNQALSGVTDNSQQGDVTDGSQVTSPITSPGLTNLSLTDYYTIAIMADMIDSPSSVVDSKSHLLSLSNPQ